MDYLPAVTVTVQYGEQKEKTWDWTITRRASGEDFDTTFDDRTYRYDLKDVYAISLLVSKDHVSRHWKNELCTISSNLGFSPYRCKSRDLHKHLKHTLHLFENVKSITGPPELDEQHVAKYL